MDIQPGFNSLNPAGSLNFDLPIASSSIQQANEEDEAAEDERIKEKELQDLLTNAFDDLIDDDDVNDEDRSSFIDDHDSFYSSDHGYRKTQWDHQTKSNKQHPSTEDSHGSISEHSSKFPPEKSDSLNSNTSHGNVENGAGSQNGDDWERRYYLDNWEAEEESDGNNSHAETPKFKHPNGLDDGDHGQKFGAIADAADLSIPNGSEDVVQYGQKGNADYDNDEELKRKFLASNGDLLNVQVEMQQLRILYAARGREIERLNEELDTTKDKASKEFQILKRYLAKAKDEKEDCSASLEENRNVLNAAKLAMSRLEGESAALEMQLKAVSENRDDLLQKLQVSESTIESLHAQFKDLSKSENMIRAREQHVTILNGMKDKHNNEVYEFKVQIADLKERLSNREDAVEDLKRELTRLERECEQAKIEKAETVNRLIRSLEESQKECQRLVQAGAGESAVDDNVVKSLKKQLVDTRRELELYVTAAELQIVNLKANQESANIAALKNARLQNQDSLVGTLKGEVERSLACLQAKNEQLQKLQTSHQSAMTEAKIHREKSKSAEDELQNAQRKLEKLAKEMDAAKANTETKDRLERLERDKKSADTELKKREARIQELLTSKKELTDLVRQLKEELSSLSVHYEEEGRKAVEACRDACLRLHEDATKSKREEMLKQLQLIQEEYACEAKMLSQELDDVKTSYVKVCEEKDEVEQKLLAKWHAEKKLEIDTLQKKWNDQKESEVRMLTEQIRILNDKLADGLRTQNDFDKRMSERIKEVKQMWQREQDLIIQEKVLAKVKEELRTYMTQKSTAARDEENQHVEQIHRLEERVKESEAAWKEQLVNLKIRMEKEKKKALAELSLQKDEALHEKLQAIATERSKEKETIIVQAEGRVVAELEAFLAEQKERFVTALKTMQDSHAKEKAEMLHQCETKLTKVEEDYKKLLTAQSEVQRQQTDKQALSTSEEVKELRESLAALQNELRTKEEDRVRAVEELNKLLKSKSTQMEEARLIFEQKMSSFLREREAACARKNEEIEGDASNLKARLKDEELKHSAVEAKYRALKEKLKKYHRYIHAKEREFAGTLTKLIEGNNRIPDMVTTMKAEVIGILDARIQELRLRFLMEGSKTFAQKCLVQSQGLKNPEDKEIDYLRKQFAESIQKIQRDVQTFMEDCGQKVSKKIREEVATATWLMAERLDLTKTTVDALKIENHIGDSCKTSITEQTTKTSSGRGTMNCGQSGSTSHQSGDIVSGVTVQTFGTKACSSKEIVRSSKGAMEHWSSTPFGDVDAIKNRPALGLTDSAKVRIVVPQLPPPPLPLHDNLLLSPSPDTISTGTCHSNGFSSGASVSGERTAAVPAKGCDAVAATNMEASPLASFQPLTPIVDDESLLRQALFKTFATDLSLMKSAFWQSVEKTKKSPADVTLNNGTSK